MASRLRLVSRLVDAVSDVSPVLRSHLVRIDAATGWHTTVAEDPGADLGRPAISPDGSRLAFLRETTSTPDRAPRITLCCMSFGEAWEELGEWDRWPASVTWSVDGAQLIVTADDGGRCPVFAVNPGTATVTRLTQDDYTYSDVQPAPGGVIFALRSSYRTPQHPVRIDPDGAVTVLPCVEPPELPGSLEELTAIAQDGTAVRSWLVLPEGDDPAPLLLWIHGGPLGSWNPGTGGGTRGCWRPRDMPYCCRAPPCPPATDRT